MQSTASSAGYGDDVARRLGHPGDAPPLGQRREPRAARRCAGRRRRVGPRGGRARGAHGHPDEAAHDQPRAPEVPVGDGRGGAPAEPLQRGRRGAREGPRAAPVGRASACSSRCSRRSTSSRRRTPRGTSQRGSHPAVRSRSSSTGCRASAGFPLSAWNVALDHSVVLVAAGAIVGPAHDALDARGRGAPGLRSRPVGAPATRGRTRRARRRRRSPGPARRGRRSASGSARR